MLFFQTQQDSDPPFKGVLPVEVVQRQRNTNDPDPERLRRAKVRHRLANVIYYSVYMLAHDLQEALTLALQEENTFIETLEPLCTQAIANFRQVVQTYCSLAEVSLQEAFQKATFKYAIRSVEGKKYEAAELLLMEEE
jgi:hypothetical protein